MKFEHEKHIRLGFKYVEWLDTNLVFEAVLIGGVPQKGTNTFQFCDAKSL